MSERKHDDEEHGPNISDATAAQYSRLQSLIANLPATPAGVAPRAGWQESVLAAIDAAEAGSDLASTGAPVRSIDSATPKRASTGRRRWVAATAVLAMAAGVAIVLAVRRGADVPVADVIAFEVQPASRSTRGADPGVSDTLIVRGVVDGPGELRVYNAAGVEQARCTATGPDCSVDRLRKRTTLRLTMTLHVPGALQAVLFSAPLDGPSGGRNTDIDAAARAGIAVTTRDQQVR